MKKIKEDKNEKYHLDASCDFLPACVTLAGDYQSFVFVISFQNY
ncbi:MULTISPECIES: hypothetical protein [Methylophaga]|uniref:Uncharacterized protein n=1 Tax=Methylophaga aminisulfidivorans MP TaxID=1026882 RepID=F5SXD9_9GAMM|nr:MULTISPECIES: hypothetical protein [Methylophaga]EGL55071.1 hypothetical protein MAMP_02065 [Methylophaga aminisulfidivorans MP]WVI84248.1 hypothetical protein VSX76_10715 [Methylophaga thalassica]